MAPLCTSVEPSSGKKHSNSVILGPPMPVLRRALWNSGRASQPSTAATRLGTSLRADQHPFFWTWSDKIRTEVFLLKKLCCDEGFAQEAAKPPVNAMESGQKRPLSYFEVSTTITPLIQDRYMVAFGRASICLAVAGSKPVVRQT